jgi:hypothetical protein
MSEIKGLTQATVNELMHARLKAIEEILSEMYVGFSNDLVNISQEYLDSASLTAKEKKDIADKIKEVKQKYKSKDK